MRKKVSEYFLNALDMKLYFCLWIHLFLPDAFYEVVVLNIHCTMFFEFLKSLHGIQETPQLITVDLIAFP
jgi:hypothetical protein